MPYDYNYHHLIPKSKNLIHQDYLLIGVDLIFLIRLCTYKSEFQIYKMTVCRIQNF